MLESFFRVFLGRQIDLFASSNRDLDRASTSGKFVKEGESVTPVCNRALLAVASRIAFSFLFG